MSRNVFRALGTFDALSGLAALGAASRIGVQLDLGTGAVRSIGVFLVALGTVKLIFSERPWMSLMTVVAESLFALAAVDVLLAHDPTTLGAIVLAGTAAGCAAVALWLVTRQRDFGRRLPADGARRLVSSDEA